MPRSGFYGSLSSPKVDVVIDMGNPFLNRTVDGFLKIGAVRAFFGPPFPLIMKNVGANRSI
jgi:hypothetical protein